MTILKTSRTQRLLYKRVVLTSAQVLALFTTPITVIPAVTGMTIVVVQGSVSLNFNTTPYTAANGLSFIYAGTPANAITTTAASILTATGNAVIGARGLNSAANYTGNVGTAVQVTCPANPTLGDGTLTVDLWYTLKQG